MSRTGVDTLIIYGASCEGEEEHGVMNESLGISA